MIITFTFLMLGFLGTMSPFSYDPAFTAHTVQSSPQYSVSSIMSNNITLEAISALLASQRTDITNDIKSMIKEEIRDEVAIQLKPTVDKIADLQDSHSAVLDRLQVLEKETRAPPPPTYTVDSQPMLIPPVDPADMDSARRTLGFDPIREHDLVVFQKSPDQEPLPLSDLLTLAVNHFLETQMKMSKKTIEKMKMKKVWVDEDLLEWKTVWVEYDTLACVQTIRTYVRNLSRGIHLHRGIPDVLIPIHNHLQEAAYRYRSANGFKTRIDYDGLGLALFTRSSP